MNKGTFLRKRQSALAKLLEFTARKHFKGSLATHHDVLMINNVLDLLDTFVYQWLILGLIQDFGQGSFFWREPPFGMKKTGIEKQALGVRVCPWLEALRFHTGKVQRCVTCLLNLQVQKKNHHVFATNSSKQNICLFKLTTPEIEFTVFRLSLFSGGWGLVGSCWCRRCRSSGHCGVETRSQITAANRLPPSSQKRLFGESTQRLFDS